MNDYHALIEQSSSQLQYFLFQLQMVWGLAALLLLVGLWLLRPWMARRRREARVRRSIRRLGKLAMRDVSLDNGMDSLAFIDWLVLTSKEILVVTLQRGRGIMFGGEKMDTWARVVGRRTFRFPNPLLANHELVMAVKYHLPQLPVRGIVLCEEGASFPKGKPEGVLLPTDIEGDAKAWRQVEIPAPLVSAWEHLVELGSRGEQIYGRELLLLRRESGRAREVLAAVLLMLALGVTMWGGWRMLSL
ncbi:MAG: nuclease-related domain-containing protein [Thiohalomonadaceae bacterium]